MGDSIIVWGFVGIQFVNFSSKFLSCDRFMERSRVYWEDGVFYLIEECTYCRVD